MTLSARELAFCAAIAAGHAPAVAAGMAGYSRPSRDAQRLLQRGIGLTPPAPAPVTTEEGRLERVLARLDGIVQNGSDADSVAAARQLLAECRQVLETQTARQVWVIHVANARGPLPEPSDRVMHVYCDRPESIDAVVEAVKNA